MSSSRWPRLPCRSGCLGRSCSAFDGRTCLRRYRDGSNDGRDNRSAWRRRGRSVPISNGRLRRGRYRQDHGPAKVGYQLLRAERAVAGLAIGDTIAETANNGRRPKAVWGIPGEVSVETDRTETVKGEGGRDRTRPVVAKGGLADLESASACVLQLTPTARPSMCACTDPVCPSEAMRDEIAPIPACSPRRLDRRAARPSFRCRSQSL